MLQIQIVFIFEQESQIKSGHEDLDEHVCGFVSPGFILFVKRERRQRRSRGCVCLHSAAHALLHADYIHLVLHSSSSYVLMAHQTERLHHKLHEEDHRVRLEWVMWTNTCYCSLKNGKDLQIKLKFTWKWKYIVPYLQLLWCFMSFSWAVPSRASKNSKSVCLNQCYLIFYSSFINILN